MKIVGNSSDGRSQGVPKISGHPCIGRMGALRGHLCDSTAFLFIMLSVSRSLAKISILGAYRFSFVACRIKVLIKTQKFS